MSFSSDVKHEITTASLTDEETRAQLSSFIHLNSTMHIYKNNIEVQSEISNPTIARRIFSLLKDRYDVDVQLTILQQQTFDKNHVYRLRIKDKAMVILEDLGIYSSEGFRKIPYSVIVVKENLARSYLAGCFLASGSVNSPIKPDYHLEIGANTDEMAQFIVSLMERFGLRAKVTRRRNKPIVYLKAADQIADFLKVVGAYNMMMEFEDIRIQRDFRNSLTRLDNCEVANEMKTIKAGNAQLDAIYTLIEHNRYNHMDRRLIEVADLRMDNPEASLNELIEIYYHETGTKISKSGLQHRFNRIIELAQKLEEGD